MAREELAGLFESTAICHVARNHIAVQFGTADMEQHRVHGMNQIKARVNQGSVEVEHQQADAMRIKLAQETNHGQFRINQVLGLGSQERLSHTANHGAKMFLRPET